MGLLQMPPELVALILNQLLLEDGIHSFDDLISEAIYGLPTFQGLSDVSPAHLTWDVNMSKPMVASLIHSKLKAEPEQRPLTKELAHTVRFAESVFGPGQTTHFTNTLVQLAANHLPLYEIIDGLSWSSTATDSHFTVLENTLAVALYLDRPSHVETLIKLGAKAQVRTMSFGDPLTHAACHGQLPTYLLILGVSMATDNETIRRLVSSRHVLALRQAAVFGRADLFCRDLYTSMEHMYAYYGVIGVYEPIIKAATLASRVEVVFAVFRMLDGQNADILNVFGEEFWVETLRLASSNNLGSVVGFILSRTSILSRHGSLNFPTEDASRSGHLSVLALLIANHSEDNLTSWGGIVYWLARGAHYDALSSLLADPKGARPSLVRDALSGASSHGARGMIAILRIVGEDLGKDFSGLGSEIFSEVIDSITCASCDDVQESGVTTTASAGTPAQPYEGDIFQDLTPPEDIELAGACARGNFPVVRRIVAKHADQRPPLHSVSTSCFMECIKHNRPGILQYLCEKVPESARYLRIDMRGVLSTATLQVLLDHGWDINQPLSRTKPPVLGYIARSEELTRWFLDHGADPNARCDWDLTPLSVAIGEGSLSAIYLMIQYGGDTRKGQLLHFVSERSSPDQLALMDHLIASGASVNARMFETDKQSWLENHAFGMGTSLHKAAEIGKVEVVKYLIGQGSDHCLLDSVGRTAFDLAVARGFTTIARILEERSHVE
ncbi:hypothetical protein MBLNU230_g7719t1 [Neophaeotheca triangularis]